MISAEALWDALLSRGKAVYGVASDDGVEGLAGRGAILVQAEAFTPAAISRALHTGRFYATTGVTFQHYQASPQEIRIVIDREHRVTYKTQFIGREGRRLAETADVNAHYRSRGDEGYIRVKVVDSKGRQAWTQAVFLRQAGIP